MEQYQVTEILNRLERAYPEAGCQLQHKNVFELLVATVLSAQTTDKSVNQVTPELFRRYPDPESLGAAEPEEVMPLIRRIGMYRQKSKNIVNLSRKLTAEFGGSVPQDREKLQSLPGVGRKTANVVLSVGFGEQHIAVDTHVFRVANRIGLAEADSVEKTEKQLMENIPEARWTETHHSLIFHGRNCCHARRPECGVCIIRDLCRYPEGEGPDV